MFYPFAEGLPHETTELAIIWEVETALSAVLTEANESEMPICMAELEPQARGVLGSRKLSAKAYAESCLELKFVADHGAHLLEGLVNRLADRGQRHFLKIALTPEKDKILSAVASDDDFAAYLRRLSKLGNEYTGIP